MTDLGEFVWISSSAVITPVGIVGPDGQWDDATFVPIGYHMAFDDPDGGLFVALTEDPNPDGYSSDLSVMALTAYHPPTALNTPHEDHIHQEGNLPFTVTSAGYGHFFTIWPEAETYGCPADTYPYTRIQRRDWEFFVWDQWDCGSSPLVCCAALGAGVTIDAITIPHYVDPP